VIVCLMCVLLFLLFLERIIKMMMMIAPKRYILASPLEHIRYDTVD